MLVSLRPKEKRNPRADTPQDHHRVLPAFFNATFDKREARARKALAEVVAEGRKKK